RRAASRRRRRCRAISTPTCSWPGARSCATRSTRCWEASAAAPTCSISATALSRRRRPSTWPSLSSACAAGAPDEIEDEPRLPVDFLADIYLWTKSFHIVAIIAWMAGLLHLPRLFVYHCDTEPGPREWQRLDRLGRRRLCLIMHPAVIAPYMLGIMLALTPGLVDWRSGWLYAKLVFVAGLAV